MFKALADYKAKTIPGLTVGELKAQLSQFPDNAPIFMSADPEGNDIQYVQHVAPADANAVFVVIWPGRSVEPTILDWDTVTDDAKTRMKGKE